MEIQRPPNALTSAAARLTPCASVEEQPPPKPIMPVPGLGTATFAVTAQDEKARAWFAQGLQLTYAFQQTEAVRVFRAALALDPTCAMCA